MAPKISEEAKEEKRVALLNSALECFSKKGYYATSVDDVVTYSKLSKGSFYNYFKSKEEIFISLMQYQTEKSLKALTKKLNEISSPTEKIKYMINLDLPMNLNKKKLMRVHLEFWMYSADNPEIKEIMVNRFNHIIDNTKAILKEGKDKGEFREDLDIDNAASMFWGLHDGIWIHTLVLEGKEEFEAKIKEIETTFLRYIK
ncbi:TetR/AcrR family transcriptional regulator [Cytobacillus suaedae]|nr:TetR/AcrR family transcriptional regulator [Cytobacillus suaedae]